MTLHADSIRIGFKNKDVLRGIYFKCNTGDIIGLLGRNGCGKSTLLKIIYGSLEAETGYVRVGDQVLCRPKDNRQLIAYLPQDYFLPKRVKVRRVINLFSEPVQAKLISGIDVIHPLLKKRVYQLSGGEHRLLEILLIIHGPHPFVLLDEPFNGVAPVYRPLIKDCIGTLSSSKGFVITDHDYTDVLDTSNRLMTIKDGYLKELSGKRDLLKWGYLPEI